MTAILVAPVIGITIVIVFIIFRDVLFASRGLVLFGYEHFLSLLKTALDWSFDMEIITMGAFSIAALVVHLFLPMLALCIILIRNLTYLQDAIGWARWFIVDGETNPLKAVGYVAACVIFLLATVAKFIFS